MNTPKDSRQERLTELKAFLTRVNTVELSDEREFQQILGLAQQLLELADQDLATILDVSRPTISRWISGRTIPYPALRKPIYRWVASQLVTKIKNLEAIRFSDTGSFQRSPLPLAAKGKN